MPTYRVMIRRATTLPPVWDFMQTRVASSQDIAIGRAYESWVSEKLTPPPPPLSECEVSAKVVGTLDVLGASPVNPAQQAFIDALRQKVSTFVATKLDGAFSLINYPSGFHYGITYGPNAYYNKATLQDIDALVGMAPNGQLDLGAAGFSSLYYQVLPGVTFSFSSQDQNTMNQQDQAASAQIASILTEFTNAGGTYSNPLPPIGGRLQDVFNQLITAYGSIANLPVTLNALRNAIATYESQAGDSYALHNRYFLASARVAAALANTVHPGVHNGGMQVDNNDYYVGFTPENLPTANQLLGGLETVGNSVSLQVDLFSFSSDSTNLNIEGGTSFVIPIELVLGISVNASASYSLAKYVSSSSNVTMDISYPGVTVFAAAPSALSADNTQGWYANDVLTEVVAKTGQDATGFKLQGTEYSIPKLFGRGEAFARLKTWVISQCPTIVLTFTNADSSQLQSDFQANASVKLDLFDLFPLGGASGSYSVQKVDSDSKAGSVIVTFGPPAVSGTTPPEQQVANVLGGVVAYPPDLV